MCRLALAWIGCVMGGGGVCLRRNGLLNINTDERIGAPITLLLGMTLASGRRFGIFFSPIDGMRASLTSQYATGGVSNRLNSSDRDVIQVGKFNISRTGDQYASC